MRLGVFTTFTPEYTFEEACNLIKALGYVGVQPRVVADASTHFDPAKPYNPWSNNKGGIPESEFFANPQKALQAAANAGLEITSIASYTNTSNMDRAVRMVKACSKAGIRNVRIGSMPLPRSPRFDYPKFLDASRGVYKELVSEAKRHGVRPCLELHDGTAFPGPSGSIAFLRGFDPETVGVLYDPANMISDGWEVPGLSINILGPYLAEVHVKNSKWVPNRDDPRGVKTWKVESAYMEDGCVNWAEVIEQLKLHRYTGWLVEEGNTQSHGRDTYTRLKMTHQLLTQLLAADCWAG